MKVRKAERLQSKIKIAISGNAGSGKTYSSLLLAKGMVTDMNKVFVIDSEAGSANLYSHLGAYNIITLDSSFSPERYIAAIDLAEKSGAECIIIDSLSHCWEFLIFTHSRLSGNSFSNWSLITPRHKALINSIQNSSAHVIATMRSKTDYILEKNDKGKLAPQKVGLKPIQRDGIDYEFTIFFELDFKHNTTCSKDRTNLFSDREVFRITTDTGAEIIKWCSEGTKVSKVKQLIVDCTTITELQEIFNQYKSLYNFLKDDFQIKKNQLSHIISNQTKVNHNGYHRQ